MANRMKRRFLLLFAVPLLRMFSANAVAQTPQRSFEIVGDHFELDHKPFQIIAGEIHYARIPHQYWRQRMEMAKAMGLNTLATYVFWNVHEPQPGVYNFSGDADLSAFLTLAKQEHLNVLLRAGPYSCAEWEFGGFPAWLLKDPRMSKALRANDPAFLVPVEKWMKRLGQEVGKYQIGYGGPVIATQIENEYGNFSNDPAYMARMKEIFLESGFNQSLLYTVDPSKALGKGQIDGVLAGVNFGTGRAKDALDVLAAFRPGQPLFASEYWPGWFDLWGHPHETRPIGPQLEDLNYILGHHASLNIYMFHGGTSFGMMAGASRSTGRYRGNVTSYDYDAPLDEAGHPTPKFFAYRDVILKATGEKQLPLPPTPNVVPIPKFAVHPVAQLWEVLPAPVSNPQPLTMEQLGQSYGYVLYRKQLTETVRNERLELDHPYDYAQIYVDGRLVGTLDRHYEQNSLQLNTAGPAGLDILVENTGRLNSTAAMRDERKGMRGARLGDRELTDWQMYSLPMDNPAALVASSHKAGTVPNSDVPHFSVGSFELAETGDSFLDVRELGKGLLWINGHALGRFWNIGPQDTLYVPGPWLKKGRNEVIVFELKPGHGPAVLSGLTSPILDGPTPGYAEDPERTLRPGQNTEFGKKLTVPADADHPH
jgi:beta-galactosidase